MPIQNQNPKASPAYTLAEIKNKLSQKKPNELRVHVLKNKNQSSSNPEHKNKNSKLVHPKISEVKAISLQYNKKSNDTPISNNRSTHEPPGLKRK